jgi:hypothetical protein
MKSISLQNVILTAILGALVVLGFMFIPFAQPAVGSVSISNSYSSTSTDSVDASATVGRVVKNGSGEFGSFVVTAISGGAGPIRFWDATSTATSSYQNEDNTSTSTTYGRLIAQFDATTTSGTYTLDVNYFKGLVVEVPVAYGGKGVVTFR